MATDSDTPELTEALAKLETCFETPFVPGDLESWAHNARESLGRVDPLLRRQIRDVHAPQLKAIGSEDPELLARVDQLRAGDEQCLAKLEALQRTFETLDELASDIEPDETKLKTQLDELVKDGLAFVIHVRKQIVALRTWLQEAFDRDRGTVD